MHYTKTMCKKSLEILDRTVMIPTDPKNSAKHVNITIKNIKKAAFAMANNEKIVFIDNRRFRQGEYLNNEILIERIENDQITFRNGNTTVTRNVGN